MPDITLLPHLPEGVAEEIMGLLAERKTIAAIHKMRTYVSLGLREAKIICEAAASGTQPPPYIGGSVVWDGLSDEAKKWLSTQPWPSERIAAVINDYVMSGAQDID